jgi:hypothetical protein
MGVPVPDKSLLADPTTVPSNDSSAPDPGLRKILPSVKYHPFYRANVTIRSKSAMSEQAPLGAKRCIPILDKTRCQDRKRIP